jgi:pilus assembly protein CpaF
VLLQALNTGHSGAATIHANSLQAVAGRLIGIGQTQGLTSENTALLATTAFDTVIQLGFENGRRKLVGIGKLQLHPVSGLQVTETVSEPLRQEFQIA